MHNIYGVEIGQAVWDESKVSYVGYSSGQFF